MLAEIEQLFSEHFLSSQTESQHEKAIE